MTEDNDLNEPMYRVVCAAVRTKQGLIICGARHNDNIMKGVVERIVSLQLSAGILPDKEYDLFRPTEDGFLNNKGEFLTREEAWSIAEKAGQIRPHPSQKPGVLHSEDLY